MPRYSCFCGVPVPVAMGTLLNSNQRFSLTPHSLDQLLLCMTQHRETFQRKIRQVSLKVDCAAAVSERPDKRQKEIFLLQRTDDQVKIKSNCAVTGGKPEDWALEKMFVHAMSSKIPHKIHLRR